MPSGQPAAEVTAAGHTTPPSRHSENVLASDAVGGKQRKKTTRYITEHQAMNLMEAFEFAERIGRPLNVSVDIYWLMFSGNVDDRTRFSRAQERWSKWTARHDVPSRCSGRGRSASMAACTPMYCCTYRHG